MALLEAPLSSATNSRLEHVLSDVARLPDDTLGIDHVNRNKGLGKGDSIFIR